MAGKVGHFEACCKTKKRIKEGTPNRDSGQFWGNTQSLRDTAKRADRKAAIKEKFSGVFHHLGKLKGFQLKLHINTNLQPVSKQVQQIPFSTRAKVNEKLDELLKFDRIEKVQWPTSGVNPLVVVEKPNRQRHKDLARHETGKSSYCEREHPVLTLEETLQEVSYVKVYSWI